ncbi:MBL fold metallo-hydrolase [Candidatus Azambacteria bacterium]|nr:MBL fold metallo-hydrolase [Candidatus Azambacteria bacterium]
MTLSWYGQGCFRIEAKGTTLALDPYPKGVGLTPPRFRADIVLGGEGMDEVGGMVIRDPGEYEVKEIAIQGLAKTKLFRVEMDEIRLGHLGPFPNRKLSDEEIEFFGEVDVLFLPVGGNGMLDAAGAEKVINQVEPRLAIPMYYKIPGLAIKLDPVGDFLKEMGSNGAAEERTQIKKKDLPEGETEVRVLKQA